MSEVAIVGGGLAGAAAAVLLARDGRRVTLFEREAAPAHKVCGEFLSAGAQARLAMLGIDLDALGASRIARVRVAAGARWAEAPLPFVARGLGRRRLDAAMLDRAAACGAEVLRGRAVRGVRGRTIATAAGELAPVHLLLASGKHEVRGGGRDAAGCATGFVGFKMRWRVGAAPRAALAGRVDVVLFDGGYAGVQLVEDGIANLCLLVEGKRLAALGGSWDGLWRALAREPALAATLGDAEPLLPRALTVAGVPYGYLARASGAAMRLGDQAAVIPSFCGEGMAIALLSAVRAADAIIGGTAAGYQAALARELATPVARAMRLQRAGGGRAARRVLPPLLRWAPGLATAFATATRV